MKIGIDARMYGPKQGGLGRYIQQLITYLEQLPGTDEFVVFMRSDEWGDYTPLNPRFSKVQADILWYSWQEQVIFPRIIAKTGVDLMHFPHWNVPYFYNQPFIVTIHDLLLLHYPTRQASTLGPLSYWFKNKAFRRVMNHAASRAKTILTPSNYSKSDIIATLGIPKEKVVVTNLSPTNLPPHPAPQTVLERYKITKPFVLYVGVAFPHKNLERLIQAWTLFKKEHHTNHYLLLVGKENYFYKRLIASEAWKQCPDVQFTGFVPDDDLPAFYQSADLYIMPSLYEGYGLPPLEALTYNLPVISSNTTSLPEVLKDAALYFDPTDEQEMAKAIEAALTNKSLRTKIVAAGKEICSSYSPKAMAETTLASYKKNGG